MKLSRSDLRGKFEAYESEATYTTGNKSTHQMIAMADVDQALDEIMNKGDIIHIVSESFYSDLRNKFFKECTDPSPNSGKNAGIRKVNMTAHDLFEWFKSNVR